MRYYVKIKKIKHVFTTFIILFISIFAIELLTTSISTSSVQASTKNIQGNSIQWGNSHWVLANDGELILSDGNIDSAQSLSDTLKKSNIDPSKVKSIEFTQKTSAHDIKSMFAYLPELQKITGLGNLTYSGNATYMFHTDPKLADIDLKGFNTEAITNMAGMFNITKISKLDLSSFDTRNVTSMSAMFDDSQSLTDLNIKSFNTAKVVDMSYMFWGISVSELDLSSFDTSSVTNMEGMFDHTQKINKLNLSNFNTSNVTSMEYMFMENLECKLTLR